MPGLDVPGEHRSIVNAHFAVAPPPGSPLLLGVIGGTTEWLFAYPDRFSVTVSGADRLLDVPREELAATIWDEVARLSGQPGAPLPRWQIVKEKRATFAATPAEAARRPGAATRYRNLALAGDWTATGCLRPSRARSARVRARRRTCRSGGPRSCAARREQRSSRRRVSCLAVRPSKVPHGTA